MRGAKIREMCKLNVEEENKWSRWRDFSVATNVGPESPGIYEFAVRNKKLTNNRFVVVYVGASVDLRRRHKEYQRDGSHIAHLFKYAKSKKLEIWMRYQRFETASTAYVMERKYLVTFDYAWNTDHNHKARHTISAIRNVNDVPSNLMETVSLKVLPTWMSTKINNRWKDWGKKPKTAKKKGVQSKAPPLTIVNRK